MDKRLIEKEVRYRTSRSGGPGGQNVNKTETRVELLFDPFVSEALSAEEKTLLRTSLSGQLTREGKLSITSSVHRSQLANKKASLARLMQVLEQGLEVKPERVETKPSRAEKEKRLRRKSERGEVKQSRRWKFED